jgi:hypothetical protein
MQICTVRVNDMCGGFKIYLQEYNILNHERENGEELNCVSLLAISVRYKLIYSSYYQPQVT